MYICPKCNTLVEQPQKRWWSGWRRCTNGHILFVRVLGPPIERSFRNAFLRAFARPMIIFFWIEMALALAPERQARSGVPAIGLLVSIYYLFAGLILLLRAHLWARRTGPVQRLVPHASGRAYGYLAAVAVQVAIVLALLLLL